MTLRAALLVCTACSTLGAETAFPGPLQSTGVGPFRALDTTETGIDDEPAGVVLDVGDAVGAAMRVQDQLFYTAAPLLASPPEPSPDIPEGDVDWSRFEPRRIFRSASTSGTLGHEAGSEVLAASEPWEGDGVFDPWVVVLDDGSARLYYAGANGIGLATAPSLAGAFTKRGEPVLVDARSPSVVPDPDGDGWLMYYETPTGIGVAASSDGIAWSVESADLPLRRGPDRDDATPDEARVSSPAALVATTPAGRTIVRLYYRVTQTDGRSVLAVSARFARSSSFVRASDYAFEEGDPDAPRPFLVESTTLLYFTHAHDRGGETTRAVVAGVAPSYERFADPPAEPVEE